MTVGAIKLHETKGGIDLTIDSQTGRDTLCDGHFQHTINDVEDNIEKVEAISDELDTAEKYVILVDEVPEVSIDSVIYYDPFISEQPSTSEWPNIDQDER